MYSGLALVACLVVFARGESSTFLGSSTTSLRQKVQEEAVELFNTTSVERIIGGKDARDGRFSYAQITLQRAGDQHQCSGSLIAPDLVLTAAHCSAWFSIVHVDRHDFGDATDTYETFEPTRTILHPEFDLATFRYDFAVVHLNGSLDDIAPVRLNSNTSIPETSDDMLVMGWGATDYSNRTHPTFPNVIQKGLVNSVPNAVCENTSIRGSMLYKDEIFPEMMCAMNPGVDACVGDSGGPLIIRGSSAAGDRQVGLVSWGRGCAVYPGVYSRVSSAFGWIRDTTCQHSTDPPAYFKCAAVEAEQTQTVTPRPTSSPTGSPTSEPGVEQRQDVQSELDGSPGVDSAISLATNKEMLDEGGQVLEPSTSGSSATTVFTYSVTLPSLALLLHALAF